MSRQQIRIPARAASPAPGGPIARIAAIEETLEGHPVQVDNTFVQRLASGAPGAFGIFGYSFLDQNRDRIEGKTVDGVAPT